MRLTAASHRTATGSQHSAVIMDMNIDQSETADDCCVASYHHPIGHCSKGPPTPGRSDQSPAAIHLTISKGGVLSLNLRIMYLAHYVIILKDVGLFYENWKQTLTFELFGHVYYIFISKKGLAISFIDRKRFKINCKVLQSYVSESHTTFFILYVWNNYVKYMIFNEFYIITRFNAELQVLRACA